MNRTGTRRFIDLLGVRLGLVLGLALLPVGVIAMSQSADLIAKAREQSEAALAGETLRAVRPRLSEIKRAQGAAEMLAAFTAAGQGDCNAGLAPALSSGGGRFAALYATDGQAICTTKGAPRVLPSEGASARVITQGIAAFTLLRSAGGAMVTAALVPVSRDGAVVAAIAVVAVDQPQTVTPVSDDRRSSFALVVFDAAGAILSASLPLAEASLILPRDRSLSDLVAQTQGRTTFTESAMSGTDRSYSLVPVVEDELFALGTWPEERMEFSFLRSLPPLVLPALMWAISLLAAWFAAEKLVARHIRQLRRAILDFADGSRSVRDLPMQTAPQEIRDTAEAFARMTTAILRDEAELEDALHGKEVLLREVHHRVKNNLQLIASIVNMQIRRTHSEEARQIMRSLQERMLSLATIHNSLYRTADVSEIQVDGLFPGIVDQIVRAASAQGRIVRLGMRFDRFTLLLDQAVPLALLLTEALSNALRFASSDTGEPPALAISLVMDSPDTAVLEVTNDAAERTASSAALGDGSTGIGTQLLRGFTRQLGGQFHREFGDGRCQVRVWFPLRPKGAG